MKALLHRIDLHLLYLAVLTLLVILLPVRGLALHHSLALSAGIIAAFFAMGQGLIWTRNTGRRQPPQWDAILVNEVMLLTFCGLGYWALG